MGGWIPLLVALDLAVVVLLLLWLVSKFRGDEPASKLAFIEKCGELHDSMKLLVQRAEKVSGDMVFEIERERNLANEISGKLQHEKEEARLLIQEAEKLLGLSEQRLAAAQSYEPSERKYEEALDLYRQGLSREEILKRVDISDGELELVLSLRNS